MKIDHNQHSWIKMPALDRIFEVFAQEGAEARVVGGAVRDTLLGREVQDIDLAVNISPQESMSLFRAAGIKIVPTGIAYGTIMAVIDGKGYEITSLRRDLETNGRHAMVTYTEDWAQDAQRRDFTINALYMDCKGHIYDYVGGLADIATRTLRFIGKPQDRITEDVLRILRYFRFIAELGESLVLVDGALDACRELASKVPQLSAERVWKEISRLLMGATCVKAMRLMQESGVVDAFLPQATQNKRFEKLLEIAPQAYVIVRLASLLEKEHKAAAEMLRLSNKDKKLLLALERLCPVVQNVDTALAFRQILYDEGREAVHGVVLLLMAQRAIKKEKWFDVIEAWHAPAFPLCGKDLLALGLLAGPEMGSLLKEVEQWWREEDFQPSREDCLAHAQVI